MILGSRKGQELAKYLARPIVAQLAPDEIEDFDDLAEDFFDDPGLKGDRTLGSGLGLLPDLVVILMFVSTTLERLLATNGAGFPEVPPEASEQGDRPQAGNRADTMVLSRGSNGRVSKREPE